jgi:penicillin-binding protein 2
MFERRLKILLGIVFSLAAVMFARAVQLQVAQKDDWEKEATRLLQRPGTAETSRGRILDRKGRVLASDAPCIDVAVDYRAIALDPDWIKRQAALRLPPRSEKLPAGVTRAQLLAQETDAVKADIDHMWKTIGQVCNKTPEEIEEIKQEIQGRVTLLQRNAWYKRFSKAHKGQDADDGATPAWRRWLAGEGEETDDAREAAINAAQVNIGEQSEAHVIVEDINDQQQVALQKALPDCPGLELKQSTHRRYDPVAARVAAHVLGHVAPVTREEVLADKDNPDALRRYLPRDEIGRDGVERLAEASLRGTKGQLAYYVGKRDPEVVSPAVPGEDVTTTIDLDLQRDIDAAFEQSFTVTDNDGSKQTFGQLHGAAVVIDVPTGEVLAMVSHPTYDLNAFQQDFHKLAADEEDKPLLNRATQQALPPGSMAKTIIGSVGVTRGVITPTEGIECTGFLQLPDPKNPARTRVFEKRFRCWTARLATPISHHSQPEPQVNRYDGRAGFLSLEDGIERSCNVYFETVAWRLKMPGVIDAFNLFGLGRRTGVGLDETPGTIRPPTELRGEQIEGATIGAGIGQGYITATPIQMANVAATLARNGIWLRPELLTGDALAHRKALPKDAFPDERRDLHLSQDALAAIRRGMIRVLRSRSGTGPSEYDLPGIRKFFDSLDAAGKTGSAQIAGNKLSLVVRDGQGKPVREDPPPGVDPKTWKGDYKRQIIQLDERPWFHGTGAKHDLLAHAWIMGYAPASNPKIAFCCLVEYGGSGGRVAGPISKALLESCVRNGYLQPVAPITTDPTARATSSVELLHEE